MFKAFFAKNSSVTKAAPHAALSALDTQLMVNMLCSAASIMPLAESEAKTAASYLSPRSYREGAIIIEEASQTDLHYMLWILEGEVTFEARSGGGASKPITVRVLGPGAELGSMSMFDGKPRSLRGTASVTSRCAMLTRKRLQALCREHPHIGSKLMALICMNFAQSLRELTTKFKSHVRLNNVLSAELINNELNRFDIEEKL